MLVTTVQCLSIHAVKERMRLTVFAQIVEEVGQETSVE